MEEAELTALFYLNRLGLVLTLSFLLNFHWIRYEWKQEIEKHNFHMKTWLNTDERQGGGVAQ